jgi:F420-0:gamma-glutamyl ligase
MGKRDDIPIVVVRGYDVEKQKGGTAQELHRPEAEDLFR